MDDIKRLVPAVQKQDISDGKYTVPQKFSIDYGKLENRFDFFLDKWMKHCDAQDKADIVFVYNNALHEQGYIITIEECISIEYSSPRGAFYALTTLKQLILNSNGELSRQRIEDWPDFCDRGLMLDVSRGRMTRIDVIKDMIELLAELKYNQFQLYFDAIIFDYDGLEKYTEGKVLYSTEEIKELDAFCRKWFIELVPNQNSFGHMAEWLRLPELSPLAITNDNGTPCGTLNPLDERSLELMDSIYSGLLPSFSSEKINIGCDETDLGKGQTKLACEQYGNGKVYLDYILKLYKLITEKYGRKPMIWNDIVMRYPELIEQLPDDIITIEWGYEFDHPFEEHCKRLNALGVNYYVSPGTSAWCSFCGRSENMLENLCASAKWAKEYNAQGYLLTDWGDGGQPQPIACSLISYVLGGMYSWHAENQEKSGKKDVYNACRDYANRFIFKTDFDLFDWIFRSGKYTHLEEKRYHNATMLFREMWDGRPVIIPLIGDYMNRLSAELDGIKLSSKYAELILRELKNVCRFVSIIADPEKYSSQAKAWEQEYIATWNMRSKNDPNGYGINIERLNNYLSVLENAKKAVRS